jgi:hypothetical protein
MVLERIFSFSCDNKKLDEKNSILGDINSYCKWGLNYDYYEDGKMQNLPIVKVWIGR